MNFAVKKSWELFFEIYIPGDPPPSHTPNLLWVISRDLSKIMAMKFLDPSK